MDTRRSARNGTGTGNDPGTPSRGKTPTAAGPPRPTADEAAPTPTPGEASADEAAADTGAGPSTGENPTTSTGENPTAGAAADTERTSVGAETSIAGSAAGADEVPTVDDAGTTRADPSDGGADGTGPATTDKDTGPAATDKDTARDTDEEPARSPSAPDTAGAAGQGTADAADRSTEGAAGQGTAGAGGQETTASMSSTTSVRVLPAHSTPSATPSATPTAAPTTTASPRRPGSTDRARPPRGPRGLARRIDDHRGPVLTGLVAAVVAVVLASLAVLAFSATSTPTTAAATATTAPPAGPPPLVGPAVLSGRVVEVGEPGTVVVEVQGQRVPVDVVGTDFSTNPPCAQPGALAFARDTLDGQLVTLVPDPTLPTTPRIRAYLVLRSQLSYTDAAIGGGWALPAESQYRAVYDDELERAQDDGEGMWGPPCRRAP